MCSFLFALREGFINLNTERETGVVCPLKILLVFLVRVRGLHVWSHLKEEVKSQLEGGEPCGQCLNRRKV